MIANEDGKPFWYAYPRWIDGESAVVYRLNNTGKGQLYVYQLKDGSTQRTSTNANADYRYIPRGDSPIWTAHLTALRNACLAKAHELGMGIVAMKVIGAEMLGSSGAWCRDSTSSV